MAGYLLRIEILDAGECVRNSEFATTAPSMNMKPGRFLPLCITLILLNACHTPSLKQPVNVCNPPQAALSQSSSLTLTGDSLTFVWHPDGQAILYSSPSGQLNLVTVGEADHTGSTDGLQLLWPVTYVTNAHPFSLSTDAQLAFAAQSPSQTTPAIFVLDLTTGRQKQLTHNHFSDSAPVWHPDENHITFRRDDGPQNRVRIYTVDSEQGSEALFIDAPAWDYSWSPDGEALLFVSGTNESHDLYTIQAGSEIARIVDMQGCDRVADPIWSPAGQHLAYVARENFSTDIHLIRSDGTEWSNLTDTAVDEYQPAWSPDGSKLAYVLFDGKAQDIFVLDVAEKKYASLTNTPNVMESQPRWSPDGEYIAFISYEPPASYHLDVIQVSSGERSRLATISH